MARIARLLIAGMTVLALLTVGTAAPGTSQVQARSTLKVSPGVYVAGQKMTYTGSLGANGRKTVRLQFHMNRPGDRWTNVAGFSSRTDARGRFKFTYPAPAMWGISYRVVSGRLASPPYKFHAKSQEVVLSVGGDNTAEAGDPFVVAVDTTPNLSGRQDLPPPAIPGRTVTLQQRVNGNQWRTVDTGQTDRDGEVRFTRTVADPGQVVYRVREENWTQGGNKIGWFPSFPTYVDVLPAGGPAAGHKAPQDRDVAPWPLMAAGGSPNASTRYGWGGSLWDFAWEYGESLTSKPFRGKDRKGRWIDTSNGSGRASHVNGGLGLDSRPGASAGPGDHGTTWGTLEGNPQKYGRWEVRLRSWSREGSAQDYRVKIELVPDRAADYRCGAQNITVADYGIHTPAVKVGANAVRKSKSWTYTKKKVALADVSHNYAVEVARDHITWFLDGKPIATVKDRAAISGVPLTLRVSLQGDGDKEMNRTRAMFDWMRAWSIDTGRRVTSGSRMNAGTHNATC